MKDSLELLNEAISKKLKALVYEGEFSGVNAGVEKKAYNFLKEEKLPVQATKESQDLPKVLIRPDLLKVPVNYTRGMQMGPIIENASKMDKIASAINELFPKVPTDPRDEALEKQQKVLSRQEKAIIKRDELLAQHEQAHAEKDMKLKELQKAIKQVNGHAQHYRAKAIEHFTNSLDAEVAGNPGR